MGGLSARASDRSRLRARVVAALVLAFVAAGSIGCGSDDVGESPAPESAPTSSVVSTSDDAEVAIREVVDRSIRAMQQKDDAAFNLTQCANKQLPADPGGADDVTTTLARIQLQKLDAIAVTGETATAQMTFTHADEPSKQYTDEVELRKENGSWLIC